MAEPESGQGFVTPTASGSRVLLSSDLAERLADMLTRHRSLIIKGSKFFQPAEAACGQDFRRGHDRGCVILDGTSVPGFLRR